MKVGSFILCVSSGINISEGQKKFAGSITFPKVHRVYVARGFETFSMGRVGVHLEEIINPVIPELGFEPYFDVVLFREIDPMDISELLEVMEAVEA